MASIILRQYHSIIKPPTAKIIPRHTAAKKFDHSTNINSQNERMVEMLDKKDEPKVDDSPVIIQGSTLNLTKQADNCKPDIQERKERSHTMEFHEGNQDANTVYKYIIAPISTIGCGKTTTFQTLSDIFPSWAHIQNDNVSGNKIKFIKACFEELAKPECKVLLADRNNHQLRERDQLFRDFNDERFNKLPSNVKLKFIAGDFVSNGVRDSNHWKVTYERVVERGDRHQNIKCKSKHGLTKSIMRGFINRFQKLDIDRVPDCNFSEVIKFKINKNSSIQNAKIIIRYFSEIDSSVFNRSIPNDQEITESFTNVLKNKAHGQEGKIKRV